MNISDFIVELLKAGNTVELTGFGTLTPQMEQAHHNRTKGTFFPTRRTIVFDNKTVGSNDILRQIAERECVDIPVAEMMWKNYIDALHDKLDRCGTHTFEGIGTITKEGTSFGFNVIEGLNLDGDSTFATPINDVHVYTPKDEVDPFAAFENPAEERFTTSATNAEPIQPETAPTPTVTLVTPVDQETSSTESTTIDSAATTTDNNNVAEEEQSITTAEERPIEPQAEPTTAHETEQDTDSEATSTPQAKEKTPTTTVETPESTQFETKNPTSTKDTNSLIDELNNIPDSNPSAPEKIRKKHTGLWIVLLILLLLIGGGAYYYFVYREQHGDPIGDLLTKKQTNTEQPTTPAAATDTQAITPTDNSYYFNEFTYNYDLIEFNDAEVNVISDEICDFLREYINTFVSNKHYSTARTPMMERVKEYAQGRLPELLSTDHFYIQRFLPCDDYIHNYCEPFLKYVKQRHYKTSVQAELMDFAILDQMLNELIGELGLQSDVMAAAAPAAPAVKTPKYTATFTSSSKQGFDIVAGFYTDKLSADRMAIKLKGLGCDAYVIDKNHLYYVSMGSAASRTEAEAKFKHIKSWYSGDIAIRELR